MPAPPHDPPFSASAQFPCYKKPHRVALGLVEWFDPTKWEKANIVGSDLGQLKRIAGWRLCSASIEYHARLTFVCISFASELVCGGRSSPQSLVAPNQRRITGCSRNADCWRASGVAAEESS